MQLILLAVVNCVLTAFAITLGIQRITPQTSRAVFAVLVHCVKLYSEPLELCFVVIVIRGYSLARFERGVGWRHAFAHHLDYRVRAVDLDALFAAACRSGGADFVVDEQATPDQRRISHSPRELMKQPACSCCSRDVSLFINRDAVDCSSRRMSDVFIGKRKQRRSYLRAVVELALRRVGRRGGLAQGRSA